MSVTIKAPGLNPGDRIELGMSHMVKVDGDENWVSLKMTTLVGVGEKPDDAYRRVEKYLTEQMRTAVKTLVSNVEEMSTT